MSVNVYKICHRGSEFKSSHQQLFTRIIYLLLEVEMTKIKKKVAVNGPFKIAATAPGSLKGTNFIFAEE